LFLSGARIDTILVFYHNTYDRATSMLFV